MWNSWCQSFLVKNKKQNYNWQGTRNICNWKQLYKTFMCFRLYLHWNWRYPSDFFGIEFHHKKILIKKCQKGSKVMTPSALTVVTSSHLPSATKIVGKLKAGLWSSILASFVSALMSPYSLKLSKTKQYNPIMVSWSALQNLLAINVYIWTLLIIYCHSKHYTLQGGVELEYHCN